MHSFAPKCAGWWDTPHNFSQDCVAAAEAARLPRDVLSRTDLQALCLAYVNLTESTGATMEAEQLKGFLTAAGLDRWGFDELAKSFDVSGDGSIDVRELVYGIARGFALHLNEQLLEENRLHKDEIARLRLWGEAPLISQGAPVRASVRGPLADVSVVTTAMDMGAAGGAGRRGVEEGRRWQAASDGNGTAREGEHWVEVDLGAPAVVDGVVLDWEVRGYSDRFSILGRLDGDHDFGSGSAGSSTAGAAIATARRWRLMLNSSRVDLSPRVYGQHLQHFLAIPHGMPSRPTVGIVAPREGNNIVATRGSLFPVST